MICFQNPSKHIDNQQDIYLALFGSSTDFFVVAVKDLGGKFCCVSVVVVLNKLFQFVSTVWVYGNVSVLLSNLWKNDMIEIS